jgi:hypothetical protein
MEDSRMRKKTLEAKTYIVGSETAVDGLEGHTLPLCILELLKQFLARRGSILSHHHIASKKNV